MGRITCRSKSVQIKAHHLRRYASERDIPDSKRQFLWTTSMNLIEAGDMAHSYRSVQKFNWYTDVNFQWHALIYALGELIARPIGESKDNAWAQIEGIFRNHPNFISDHKRPLHITMASLCLKASQSLHKAQTEKPQSSSRLDTPPFVQQREAEETKVNAKRNEASKMILGTQAEDTYLTAHPRPTDTLISPKISGQQPQPVKGYEDENSPRFDCTARAASKWDDMDKSWKLKQYLAHEYVSITIKYQDEGNDWWIRRWRA